MTKERKILRNKPLIEAIFEIRWNLQKIENNLSFDPYYKIFLEIISNKLRDKFPYYEKLGTAALPEEVAFYNVQHRLRKEENKWPVIQVGPGIITINATDDYEWNNFYNNINNIIELITDYKIPNYEFKIKNLNLRYIDAISLDENEDIFQFFKDNLKIEINICKELFEDQNITNKPSAYNFEFSYKTIKPKSIINIKLSSGKKVKEDINAILWESLISTDKNEIPQKKEDIKEWLNEAHSLIVYKVFFKLIEGKLEEKFK